MQIISSLVVAPAVIFSLFLSVAAKADWVCSGALTQAQETGFQSFFSPAFSPSLTHMGGPIAQGHFSKVVDAQKLQQLAVAAPRVAVSKTLDDQNASVLRSWLNNNADFAIPSWFATAVGIFVPQAWVGITADVAIQLISANGDAGRKTLANIAGTVSSGGRVAVTERIAKTSNGENKYLWTYVYQAKLNDKELNFLLYSCNSDIVVK